MGKSLVLAEKPSVGREIARVLGCRKGGEGYLEGDRYVVTWALGHLVTLADPDVYEKKWEKWDMETLPMLPQNMKLVVIPQTGRQFRVVQGLMKRGDISDLIIATDAGREGELVARWIMAKAGWKKPTRRLWISSQTDRAIKEGFQNLRPAAEYDNLFRSAQARSEADWLVGLNVTRGRSVNELRPDALERFSLQYAIQKMITDMTSVSERKVYFTSEVANLKFDEDEEMAIYRVIQESMTNAIRHGKADKVWITIKKDNSDVVLQIRDNGVGCKEIKNGFGTRHIKERIGMLGGKVIFDGSKGFTVEARIPIRWGETYD